MYSSEKLTPSQAVRYIGNFINRNGYSTVFAQDIAEQADNRRQSRKSNVAKWGNIPFNKGSNGKVTYNIDDLCNLCYEKIEPVCKDALAKIAAKIAKLGYYVPYSEAA